MRIPDAAVRWLRTRLVRRALTRGPDFRIGTADSPYLDRWWLVPRNRWFNVYLHRLWRDDDDRALHDHPWDNATLVLAGGYREVVTGRAPRDRLAGDLVFRSATAQHRLLLTADPGATWTLFVTGPRRRAWGFQCPQGWRPWQQFVDPNDAGRPGPGCGD